MKTSIWLFVFSLCLQTTAFAQGNSSGTGNNHLPSISCDLTVSSSIKETKIFSVDKCNFDPFIDIRLATNCEFDVRNSIRKCQNEGFECKESQSDLQRMKNSYPDRVVGEKKIKLTKNQLKTEACQKAFACEINLFSADASSEVDEEITKLEAFKKQFKCKD